MVSKKIQNVIEALSRHNDPASICVLEQVGTQCANDEIRELTAIALVKKNIEDSLKIVLTRQGKGINDLSSKVAMSTINALMDLKDKSVLFKILDDNILNNSNDVIRDTCRSLKAIMAFS